MCVGLGLIFGVMKVVNFAQGELLMLGMYVSLYLVTNWGVLAFLGPYAGPFVGALLAGPDGVRRRHVAAQVPDCARLRPAHHRVGGRRAFRPAHRHPGRFADAAEWRADRVRLHAAHRALAAVVARVRDRPGGRRCHAVPEQGAAGRLRGGDPGRDRAVCVAGAHQARQGDARRGRQSHRGDLYGRRRRSHLSYRLRHRQRHHRHRRRPDGDLPRRSARSSGSTT